MAVRDMSTVQILVRARTAVLDGVITRRQYDELEALALREVSPDRPSSWWARLTTKQQVMLFAVANSKRARRY